MDDSEARKAESQGTGEFSPAPVSSPKGERAETPEDGNEERGLRLDDETGAPKKVGFRGPLRYEFETSSPVLEAGKDFTIYLRITNPYDVPVEIKVVAIPLPVEFADVTGREENTGLLASWRRSYSRTAKDGNTSSGIVKDGSGTNPFGPNVAIAVGINRRPGGHVPPNGGKSTDPLKMGSVLIQPGNTVFQSVTTRTCKRLLFSPAVYNLEAWVSYVMDGQENHDAVKVPLNIKAPLVALIVGAGLGTTIATLFDFMRKGGEFEKLFDGTGAWGPAVARFGISLLSSALLGTIVIVAFARKKDAQPFVSVEDFYGGVFVGFLVGLNGAAWLNAITAGGVPGAAPAASGVSS